MAAPIIKTVHPKIFCPRQRHGSPASRAGPETTNAIILAIMNGHEKEQTSRIAC